MKLGEMELDQVSQESTSQETATTGSIDQDQLSESYDKTTTDEEGSDGPDDDEDQGVEVDINGKLQELNSLLKTKSVRGRKKKGAAAALKQKKPKTSTPVLRGKGKRGQRMLATGGMSLNQKKQPRTVTGLNYRSTVQIAGKTVQTTVFGNFQSSAPAVHAGFTDNPFTFSIPDVNMVGRRRSGRLADKGVETPINPPTAPPVSRAARAAANNSVEVIDLISAPPLILPGVVSTLNLIQSSYNTITYLLHDRSTWTLMMKINKKRRNAIRSSLICLSTKTMRCQSRSGGREKCKSTPYANIKNSEI